MTSGQYEAGKRVGKIDQIEAQYDFCCQASAVHCQKNQKKINTKSRKMHNLVHV